jgi:hypothetical protein
VTADARHSQVRESGQRGRILELLQERGTEGATNIELNEICFRYGARLWELRRAGHNIRTENLGDGLFRFVLISSESHNSNIGVSEDVTSRGDIKPAHLNDYARRAREVRDRAMMPLFAGRRM